MNTTTSTNSAIGSATTITPTTAVVVVQLKSGRIKGIDLGPKNDYGRQFRPLQ